MKKHWIGAIVVSSVLALIVGSIGAADAASKPKFGFHPTVLQTNDGRSAQVRVTVPKSVKKTSVYKYRGERLVGREIVRRGNNLVDLPAVAGSGSVVTSKVRLVIRHKGKLYRSPSWHLTKVTKMSRTKRAASVKTGDPSLIIAVSGSGSRANKSMLVATRVRVVNGRGSTSVCKQLDYDYVGYAMTCYMGTFGADRRPHRLAFFTLTDGRPPSVISVRVDRFGDI